jgi:mono/diheme cytochrome c family protein
MRSASGVTFTLLLALLAVPEHGAAQSGAKKAPALRTQASSPAPPKGDPAAGKKLFRTHCTICHFDDVNITKVGPGLKGLYQWKKLPVSGLEATDENIRRIIAKGKDEEGMVKMPPYRDVLTPGQTESLIAYLKTL